MDKECCLLGLSQMFGLFKKCLCAPLLSFCVNSLLRHSHYLVLKGMVTSKGTSHLFSWRNKLQLRWWCVNFKLNDFSTKNLKSPCSLPPLQHSIGAGGGEQISKTNQSEGLGVPSGRATCVSRTQLCPTCPLWVLGKWFGAIGRLRIYCQSWSNHWGKWHNHSEPQFPCLQMRIIIMIALRILQGKL